MSGPSWFHVFDSTAGLWLQEDEKEWGPYNGAAEFSDEELARDIAAREIATAPEIDHTVIVLGDYGVIE